MQNFHQPVLLNEVLEFLGDRQGFFLDGTIGGGGHSKALLETNESIEIIGIDKDPRALEEAKKNLEPWREKVRFIHGDFKNFQAYIAEQGISGLGGILLDLGVSSYQLDKPERGFSYHQDGPLDMRMDPTGGKTAADLLNELPAHDLSRIFKEYGEERWAKKIAAKIENRRKEKRIETTRELAEIITQTVPRDPGGHPARRVFQALRIAVNNELKGLGKTIEKMVGFLNPQGRMGVITFQSLEDRLVKNVFRNLSQCNCLKNLPCVCEGPQIKILTRKPVEPTEEEVGRNRRARSAKLRVIEKLNLTKGKEEG